MIKHCTYCGSKAHNIEFCPKTWSGSVNVKMRRCTYCGSKAHTIGECPKTWNGSNKR